MLVAAGCFTDLEAEVGVYKPQGSWIVDGPGARALYEDGALVLDARDKGKQGFLSGHLRGAVAVHWSQFSEPQDPDRGRLLDDEALLTERLREVGVRRDRKVIVLGSPIDGWGEEGRIVWMLRALGHPDAVMVDGGYHALISAGLPIVAGEEPSPPRGDFSIVADPGLTIEGGELAQLVAKGSQGVRLIDTREPGEFDGLTPYGEVRGGHVPGAVHLYYEQLLDSMGYLKSAEEMRGKLTSRQVAVGDHIIAYCTGGVRSGWLVAVLRDMGYQMSRNYAGSMWEWAAQPASTHPLEVAGGPSGSDP
jgi:thiosulfate/3-mercaptopyruvate sulfurtransferase